MATASQACESQKSTSNSNSESSELDDEDPNLFSVTGQCKWFNAARGFGFITPDPEDAKAENNNGSKIGDIFVHQKAIRMPGFRCLSEGQKVTCHFKESSKGFEAVKVTDPEGKPCKGSHKRPAKPRKRPDRCYNCGEAGHHAKECQFPPLPKRCHHCKAVDHLVADCPSKKDSTSPKPQS